MIRLLLAALVLALSVGSAYFHTCVAQQPEHIDAKILDAVVIVIAYKNATVRTGTGFVIDDQIDGRLTVVTNHHVIDAAETVFVRFRSETKPFQCDLVDSRPGLDLAALRVQGKPAKAPPVLRPENPAIVLKLLQQVLLIGQMVFEKAADGLRLPWTAHAGKVAAVERDRGEIVKDGPNEPGAKVFQLDLTTAHGMSGAPILNDNSNVVGVLFAGIDYGVSNVSFGVPHKYLGHLNLNKAAQPFAGQSDAPTLQPGGGVKRLSANEPLMQPVPTSPGIKGKTDYQINVGALNWGPVPPDPNLVIQRYIGDPQRFAEHIPMPILAQLLQRHRVMHVTNPYFHFSVLVPDNFGMTEIVPPDSPSDTLITKFISSDYPFPLGMVTVITQKIRVPDPNRLVDELNKRSSEFLRQKMGLKIAGSRDPLGLPPPREVIVVLTPLSDPKPRIHHTRRAVRFWRRYRSQTVPDRDYAFLYGIVDDIFVVAHFAINPRRADIANRDMVERFMLVSSLSFSE